MAIDDGRTTRVGVRVEQDVIDAVRERHAHLADASVSVVIRYALAELGGLDTSTVAHMPKGWTRRAQRQQEAKRRDVAA